MTLRCEILETATTGDSLRIRWQGSADFEADWRPELKGEMEVPLTKTSARTYYVGRVFRMDVSTP